MKRICAWCKEPMCEIAPEQQGITHGICESCKAKIMAEKDGQDGAGPASFFNRSRPSLRNANCECS